MQGPLWVLFYVCVLYNDPMKTQNTTQTFRRPKVELLAPAGGMEQLEYALHFGADAVYSGGTRFGLRTRANNFDEEHLREAVNKVHAAGKRMFVTVNIVMHNEDIEALADYARLLEDIGVDAAIVSDMGALGILKKYAPSVAIHVSTQASVANYETACMWHELGASRVVLARELSLEEIRSIRAHVPDDLELEVFVHGAMCMSYSGRCLISNYLTNRDANRGHCTQPCRWNYVLMEKTRPGKYFPVQEDEHGTYLMDSRDMRMLDHLDELLDAGVDSLKIEGRMKGAYYVATVVNAYRHVLDGDAVEEYLPELERVSHRPYSTGFFFGPANQTYDEAEYLQTHDLCATVTRMEGDRLVVQQRNRFFTGDEIEVLSPGSPVRKFIVSGLKTEWGELVDMANKAMDTYTMDAPFELMTGDILRRKRTEEGVKG